MDDSPALVGVGATDTPTHHVYRGMSTRWIPGVARTMAIGAAITIAYVIAARLGFRVAFVAEQITTVWAPTGIALAALLVWGPRLWPAVWLGAFIVNASAAAPMWTAAVIATGNTLEAVVGAWALSRVPKFNRQFRRVADVLTFAAIGVVLCTTVSATIGVITLCTAAVQPWSRFSALWFDWWFGDALGALIVAPAILTSARRSWSRRDVIAITMFAGGTALGTQILFARFLGPSAHPLEYVVFPIVMAAAVAGGPLVSSAAVLSASAVSIWNTVRGSGPFAGPEIHHSLILLQTFMSVLAGTALMLAAAIAERETSERREKDAVRVLSHREEMLHIAQRAGGVATFEWDFPHQIAYCSAEFFRIFGLPEQEGTMAMADWGRFVHPDDRERMSAHLERALRGDEPAATDYRIVRADGRVRWLSYAGKLQRTGGITRMLGTVVDITDRKRTELELQDAKNVAEAANRLKDQFLATLSHELRTPLNAILGYTRMLQTNAIVPEKRQHAIDVIERNAAAQHQLVEDLLDMSRITTGTVRLDPEPIPIASVLLDAVEGIRPAADAKHLVLDLDVDPFAGTVNADRSRLQQVIWNLLTNAVKFTNERGRVRAAVRSEGSRVEVSVSDTGEGIPPDFLPFVFDPFRQGDGKVSGGHGGLGLGLAISKQLVELHGGTIHASSEGAGRGATFVVRLPRREDTHLDPRDSPSRDGSR